MKRPEQDLQRQCGQRIGIKPLSVNEAYTGRRFSTPAKKVYCKAVAYQLKPIVIPEKIHLKFRFGFSHNGSDVDNPVKIIMDILQKRYRFNDNRVWKVEAEKEIVKKGMEFIEFEIMDFVNSYLPK